MARADVQYARMRYTPPQIEHHYGSQVHILSDPLSLTLLARLCAKGTVQPQVNQLVGELYRSLVHQAVAAEFPRKACAVATRMVDVTPRGVWEGEVIDGEQPAVVVAVARAGLLPSQI